MDGYMTIKKVYQVSEKLAGIKNIMPPDSTSLSRDRGGVLYA